MKLIRSIYMDKLGNEWIIQKHSLEKKRGYHVFWTAECGNREFRENGKRLLIKKIESDGAQNKSESKMGVQA